MRVRSSSEAHRGYAGPDERQSRQAEQAEHDLMEVIVAQTTVSLGPEPGTGDGSGQGPQQQPAFLACHQSFGDMRSKR